MLFFGLGIVFTIKHFVADYPLQTPYMLQKFKARGWAKPLATHCAVHAIFTYWIGLVTLWLVTGSISYLTPLACALIDFSVHFVMDRIKASPNMLGQYQALSKMDYAIITQEIQRHPEKRDGFEFAFKSNKYFWWSLGFDQMVHHLTDLLSIYLILRAVVSP